jgi:hypothetical protein
MTEMPEEARRELFELVKAWGMIGVLRALADLCGYWSKSYDPSPATEGYRRAEDNINALASDLFRMSEPQKLMPQ